MTVGNASAALEAVREPLAFDGSPPLWDQALAAMPPGYPPFLNIADIPARRRAVWLPSERDRPLTELAARIAVDAPLRHLAWYMHWLMFVAPAGRYPYGGPTLQAYLGAQAGLFYELLALEFAPRLSRWHRTLGYPPEVTHQTARQIAAYDANHVRGRGCPGVYASQFVWLQTYFTHPYVRLGRLEYLHRKHGDGIRAWKRDRDGLVLALAEPGVRVNAAGLPADEGDAPADVWTTTVDETAGAVMGYPIDPSGYIVRRPVELRRRDWTPCLDQGMRVLDLHIPAGGGMTWDAVTDSFRQAHDFFDRYHADEPFSGMVTNTWFMDPRLADILPAEANMVRLQRAMYLFPVKPNPSLWFVFLCDQTGTAPEHLPSQTSLQRALIGFLKSGRRWKGGGAFMLRKHMRACCVEGDLKPYAAAATEVSRGCG